MAGNLNKAKQENEREKLLAYIRPSVDKIFMFMCLSHPLPTHIYTDKDFFHPSAHFFSLFCSLAFSSLFLSRQRRLRIFLFKLYFILPTAALRNMEFYIYSRKSLIHESFLLFFTATAINYLFFPIHSILHKLCILFCP